MSSCPSSHLRSSERKTPPEYGARISRFHNVSRIFRVSSAPSPSTFWGRVPPLFAISARRLQALIRQMLVAMGGDPPDAVMDRPVRSPPCMSQPPFEPRDYIACRLPLAALAIPPPCSGYSRASANDQPGGDQPQEVLLALHPLRAPAQLAPEGRKVISLLATPPPILPNPASAITAAIALDASARSYAFSIPFAVFRARLRAS